MYFKLCVSSILIINWKTVKATARIIVVVKQNSKQGVCFVSATVYHGQSKYLIHKHLHKSYFQLSLSIKKKMLHFITAVFTSRAPLLICKTI